MRNVLENIKKTHFLFNKIFFSKIFPFVRQCGKIYTAGQATEDNMAQAH
jgi:hypothetical protein